MEVTVQTFPSSRVLYIEVMLYIYFFFFFQRHVRVRVYDMCEKLEKAISFFLFFFSPSAVYLEGIRKRRKFFFSCVYNHETSCYNAIDISKIFFLYMCK